MPEQVDFRNGVGVITKLALTLADQIPTPIILIDGRAGSGKTSFAEMLRNELFKQSDAAPALVHMDDLYSGWQGLRTGSSYLLQQILTPLSLGKPAHWQLWDWAKSERGRQGEPGNGWRSFSGGNILMVEGCGSISRETKDLAHQSLWIEAKAGDRKTRLRTRDEGRFDDFWGIWQAQEDEFYEAEKSSQLADWIIHN